MMQYAEDVLFTGFTEAYEKLNDTGDSERINSMIDSR